MQSENSVLLFSKHPLLFTLVARKFNKVLGFYCMNNHSLMRHLLSFFILLNVSFYGYTQTLHEKAKEVSLQLSETLKSKDYNGLYMFFAKDLANALPQSRIEALLTQLSTQFGDLDSILMFSVEERAEITYFRRGLTFGTQKFDLIFSFNNQEKVNSLRISNHLDKRPWKKPTYVDLENIQTKAIKIGTESPLNGEYSTSTKGKSTTTVVMVHGSGPNNMNERLGPNELFKDMAYGLASQGINSIRYNKRSYEYGSQMVKQMNSITIEDIVVKDAVLAVEKAREMGAQKVILLGHSLGGHIAPMIAEQVMLDAVIVMAGNASPLYSLIVPQFEYILQNDPESSINEFQVNMIKGQVQLVEEGNFDSSTPAAALPLNMPASFWNSLKDYNPAKIAKKQDIPYLILNGGRDYQVTPEEAKKWKNGNKKAQSNTIIYSKLNHMFFMGEGVCIPAEYSKRGNLEEKVLIDIVKWIKAL